VLLARISYQKTIPYLATAAAAQTTTASGTRHQKGMTHQWDENYFSLSPIPHFLCQFTNFFRAYPALMSTHTHMHAWNFFCCYFQLQNCPTFLSLVCGTRKQTPLFGAFCFLCFARKGKYNGFEKGVSTKITEKISHSFLEQLAWHAEKKEGERREHTNKFKK
jgi:hypothetical protein